MRDGAFHYAYRFPFALPPAAAVRLHARDLAAGLPAGTRERG